ADVERIKIRFEAYTVEQLKAEADRAPLVYASWKPTF
ncbi:unnamed protein product, partial [marine sediment metagenome]